MKRLYKASEASLIQVWKNYVCMFCNEPKYVTVSPANTHQATICKDCAAEVIRLVEYEESITFPGQVQQVEKPPRDPLADPEEEIQYDT